MAGPDEKPIKVAIVGGGCAGLTTAFELTRAEHQGKYEITVYQMGWRLGGKGASGRGPNGRIEEHGLHIWMGFYENAFRLIRACYDELQDRYDNPKRREYRGRTRPPEPFFKKWTDAFFPDPHVGVVEALADGTWQSWTAWFPPIDGMPGDPLDDEHNPFTLDAYLRRTALMLRTLMVSVLSGVGAAADDTKDRRKGKRSTLDSALDQGRLEFSKLSPRLIVDKITQMLRLGVLTTAAGLLQAVLIIETILKDRSSIPGQDYQFLEFLDAFAANTRRQLEDVVKIDPRLRRKTELVDLVMTTIVGVLRDDLLAKPNGLDAIDHLDAREWLKKHGATYSSVESPFIQALYDMAFGDVKIGGKKYGLSAGQALRCTVRMFFTYRGSLFWRMRSSMGEVMFAPLYQLLQARGVKFEFFHRLDEVTVNWDDENHPYVEELKFERQATLGDSDEYDPLVKIKIDGIDRTLWTWPNEPKADLIRPAGKRSASDYESIPKEPTRSVVPKKVNEHFHFVVLAIGLGAIDKVNGNLLTAAYGTSAKQARAAQRWKEMLAHMKTVATQSFQLWLRKDMASLGWTEPPVTLSGFAKPFDTWSDMTHILAIEKLEPSDKRYTQATKDRDAKISPKALAYFCGAVEEEKIDQPQKTTAELQNEVAKFAKTHLPHLWSNCRANANDSNNIEEALLVGSLKPTATLLLQDWAIHSHFETVSNNPSDRYVVPIPGTATYRISPLDDTYANLTIAGDWTACGFLGGCVEAAVMSGRLAAHAISSAPDLNEIIGYDHP